MLADCGETDWRPIATPADVYSDAARRNSSDAVVELGMIDGGGIRAATLAKTGDTHTHTQLKGVGDTLAQALPTQRAYVGSVRPNPSTASPPLVAKMPLAS